MFVLKKLAWTELFKYYNMAYRDDAISLPPPLGFFGLISNKI